MNETVNLNHAPSFSFGQKTGQEKISDTPGMIIKSMFFFSFKQKNFFYLWLAPCAYMPENVVLDHIPSYVFHKSVIIQPQGYIKCVWLQEFASYIYILYNFYVLCFIFSMWLFSGRPIIA